MKNYPVERKEIWGWALYDFANSGYTTVIITAVFNAYFVSAIAGDAPWATFAWTLTLAVSYAITMLLGPWIGARADARAGKKRALAACTIVCTLATALLAFAGPGALPLACVLVIVSNVAYSLGENLCAGFLPELAPPEKIAKVSAFGWSLGYFGGLLALAICLVLIHQLKARGASAQAFVGATCVAVALLYALASLPMFAWVRERTPPQGVAPSLQAVIAQTFASIARVKQLPELQRFMWTGLCYQAGVSVVITLAAVYAQSALGFKQEETITMLIVVNVAAALGAMLFGLAQDRFGHRHTLLWVMVVWLIGIVVLALKADRMGFWMAATLAGVGLGACQSGGRALVGFLAPENERAEIYGVWGFYTRAAAILGPITYGAMTWLTQGNHRMAMLCTGVFFVIAVFLLRTVDVDVGRARVAKSGGNT